MQTLEQEGLGKGIDATRPRQLLNTQVTPTKENLQILRIGAGYRKFKSKLKAESSIKKSLRLNVQAQGASYVNFKVGVNRQNQESERFEMTAKGKMIHNETILFDPRPGSTKNEDIHLVGLLKSAAKKKGFAYSPGDVIPKKKRYEICSDILLHENGGATHYIASVDLGGKVYAVETSSGQTRNEDDQISLEAGCTVRDITVKASIDFSEEAKALSDTYCKQVYFVVHPNVKLEGKDTVIETHQEKTIAYKVKPLWGLLNDAAWRKSFKQACANYLTPMWSGNSGLGCLIKTGTQACYYLKVTEGKVEGTTSRREADIFTIEFATNDNSDDSDFSDDEETPDVENPFCGFYLCCRKSAAPVQLYLSADTKKDEEVITPRSNVAKEHHATFYLAHPGHRKLESVSEWQMGKPLHLVRHHKVPIFFGMRVTVEKYSVLDQESGILKETKSLDDCDINCQFTLEQP